MCVDLSVVNCTNTRVRKVFLLKTIAPDKFTHITKCLVLNSIRAKLRNQFLNPAHALSPSRSATIASICVLSSACLETIPAI